MTCGLKGRDKSQRFLGAGFLGKKILVDMESLYDLINGEKTVNSPTQKNEM